MAKITPTQPTALVSPEVGIRLLKKQLLEGEQLLRERPIHEDAYEIWKHNTNEFLVKAFGKGSSTQRQIMKVGAITMVGDSRIDEAYEENRNAGYLRTQLKYLENAIELLQTDIQFCDTTQKGANPLSLSSDEVFVVHGRDDGTKETVARFIERLGLHAVILHEQPNQGRTVIEKFTEHANVGFAVVLMTADDKGGLASAKPEEYCSRARQNVIFELGFFLGKLGRGRVCALCQQGVEIPSDYSGVVFVNLDPERTWRFLLAKELMAAGMKVDLSEAL